MKNYSRLQKIQIFRNCALHLIQRLKKKETGEVNVVTTKAEGEKCLVCWKISKNGCKKHPK